MHAEFWSACMAFQQSQHQRVTHCAAGTGFNITIEKAWHDKRIQLPLRTAAQQRLTYQRSLGPDHIAVCICATS